MHRLGLGLYTLPKESRFADRTAVQGYLFEFPAGLVTDLTGKRKSALLNA